MPSAKPGEASGSEENGDVFISGAIAGEDTVQSIPFQAPNKKVLSAAYPLPNPNQSSCGKPAAKKSE